MKAHKVPKTLNQSFDNSKKQSDAQATWSKLCKTSKDCKRGGSEKDRLEAQPKTL